MLIKIIAIFNIMTKYCSECGEQLDDENDSFCGKCGARLDKKSDETKMNNNTLIIGLAIIVVILIV